MPLLTPGKFSYPNSIRQLTRGRGWNSELAGFLARFAYQDFTYLFDDFHQDTLDATLWEVATDAGSTAFAWSVAQNGLIVGATENASGDYIAVNGQIVWNSGKNCGAAIRFKQDTVATHKMEFGFTDALSDETVPALNDIDTPTITNGATDVLIIGRDTAQTLTTYKLVGDGTTGSAAGTAFDTGLLLTADTFTAGDTMLVQCSANGGFGVINNQLAQAVTAANGPDSGTLTRPHFILGTLASTAITVSIDYIAVWAER